MEKQLSPRRVFYNPIYKDKVTVLKSSGDTGGLYSLGELEVAPGGGNGMHIHTSFEETFIAVDGEIGVVLGSRQYLLKPGESITIPKNTPHHFINTTAGTVRCHVKFVPGHENFIKGLAIAYGLAGDGHTNQKGIPKNLTHMAILMVLTDTHPAGIGRFIFPVFRWLAARAAKNGTQQMLLDKYYYTNAR